MAACRRTSSAKENLEALRKGLANLGRHVENVRKFGVPVVVAINHFTADTAAEHDLIKSYCREQFGVEAMVCTHWAEGRRAPRSWRAHVVELAEGPHPLDGRGFRRSIRTRCRSGTR